MYTDNMVLLLLAAKAEDYLARARTHGGGFPPSQKHLLHKGTLFEDLLLNPFSHFWCCFTIH